MDDLQAAIANLFTETGHAHHQAFVEADGADPEWPMWYADFMYDKLRKLLDAHFTKSELIYLLVSMEKEQALEAPGANWQRYYADYLIGRYL
jgi:hypothetical protein